MRPQDLVGQKMGATDTAQIWSIDSIILPFIINVLEAPPLHQSSLPKRKARALLAKIRFLKIGKASKNRLGNQICSSGCQLQGSRFWFSSTPLHFEDSPDYVDLSSQPVYTGLFLFSHRTVIETSIYWSHIKLSIPRTLMFGGLALTSPLHSILREVIKTEFRFWRSFQ